ncbi:hypothetical protein ACY2DA_09515 [Staphylococcus simulans]
MSTVITGIGIICSEGNCKSEVLKRMKRMEVTISEVELFNCDDYLSNKGGRIKN